MSVKHQLDRIVTAYMDLQHPLGWPLLPWEEQWQSPCLLEQNSEGEPTPWRPIAINQPIDLFERLASALECEIHPDIVTYYTAYWSDPIYADHANGELSLLFAWNEDELERLRANLIGHALTKQRMRQPLTLFFACTEPDADEFISLMNNDGSVWLELPGKKPLRKLAESMTEFLTQLTPLPHPSTR